MTTADLTTAPGDERAAPLELVLRGSARGIAGRMSPNRSWTRLAGRLATRPRVVAHRGEAFAKELGAIAVGRADRAPARSDKRFADPAWQHNALLNRTMQTYLAASDTAYGLLADAELDWRDAERMRFVFDNLVEGLSPSNNPFLSPVAWKALIDTCGMSAVRGMRAFARDMASRPRVPAMVESDAFAVGETVAVTKGAVVLQTPVFELIQYAPQTDTVREIPLLMVPPVINKYYIADIAPGRSMIEYFVAQGQQVFTISWRNPQARHRDWNLDTYGAAIVEAMDAVREITGADATHLQGSCSGGILAAMTAAHLSATGHSERIAGLSLAVTVLDQRQAGFTAAAVDAAAAENIVKRSADKGYLDGRELAEVFAWLRPTDLVWRNWENNYLQGRPPAAFDVLFWSADTTRMTAGLHRDMVQIATDNALAETNAVSMLGTPIDLGQIGADAYVVGGVADHISPWQACHRSAGLLGSKDNRFVLSTSGHVAALVNPPGNPKASFQTAQVGELTPEQWRRDSQRVSGSWWTDYTDWLGERSGAEIAAPWQLGNNNFAPVAPAPGTYVHHA